MGLVFYAFEQLIMDNVLVRQKCVHVEFELAFSAAGEKLEQQGLSPEK